jgi:hypothetical protein
VVTSVSRSCIVADLEFVSETMHTADVVCMAPCSYMVLFLKFIASVVPTIEYDYTSSAGGW